MRDRPIIWSGLLLFLTAVTFPVWYNLAAKSIKAPLLRMPATAKQCVEPAAFMKESHMALLDSWREDWHDGARAYKASDGKSYDLSLTRTCLQQCHQNKAEFCDRCHAYIGLAGPYCWDCHNAPQAAPRSAP